MNHARKAVLRIAAFAVAIALVSATAARADQQDDGHDNGDSLKQRIAACSNCHGEGGAGAMFGDTYYPRLADQSKAYLLKQLHDFQAGRRRNEAMQRIVQRLPDDYLAEIAEYFSRKNTPFVTRTNRLETSEPTQDLLQRGRILATRGKPSADVPACTTCHGDQLQGQTRAGTLLTPRIVAQHESYISAQFDAWLAGSRHNDPAGVMQGVVERLSSEDRNALAVYLASTEPGEVQQAKIDYGHFMAKAPKARNKAEESLIERGRYLTRAGDCIACHTADGGEPFAGNKPLATPYGTIYTPNITPDGETGIGGYSADDFYQVMHTGVTPDGTYLYPAFPFTAYTRIKREDTDAIHAYLMSLEPVHEERRANTFGWPFSMRSLMFGWRMLYFDQGTYEQKAERSDQWNRGAYLVKGLGHCGACHTPRNSMGAQIPEQRFTGATLGDGWYAPNITSDEDYGIGQWSTDDIASLLKDGRARGKGHAIGSMSEVVHDSTQYLKESDRQAIATYLATVEPNAPADEGESIGDASEAMSAGRDIYDNECADCHGDDGEGQWPKYPALAGNHTLAAKTPTNVIRIVSHGGFGTATRAEPRPHSMPTFAAQRLTPKEVANVVTFIRSKWGHRTGVVSADQVRQAQ